MFKLCMEIKSASCFAIFETLVILIKLGLFAFMVKLEVSGQGEWLLNLSKNF